MKHEQITEAVITAYYAVYRNLGFGFLESVYQNALALELARAGLSVTREFPIKVYYRETCVGDFRADLVVNDLVIVELKAVSNLDKAHEAQVLNYLRTTRFEVALLLNFGPRSHFKRFAYENTRKTFGVFPRSSAASSIVDGKVEIHND